MQITEPSRQIDVLHTTDVLVVGAGPGGLAAALAAARAGVDVTLVERFGCFGDNITTVGVEGFAWYRHEKIVEANGIGREFEERAKAMGPLSPKPSPLAMSSTAKGSKSLRINWSKKLASCRCYIVCSSRPLWKATVSSALSPNPKPVGKLSLVK